MSGPRYLLFVLILVLMPCSAQGQEPPALPEIALEVDEEALGRMLKYPYSDHRAAVRVRHLGLTYEGELRIHGNTSRSLPKQSFRIHFESDENVFGRDVVVLRAEYRDPSYLRNYLMHRLFRHLGFHAPEMRFVRLAINGEDAGVYLEVERINSAFLEQRDLPRGDLYSLELNAGRWYPYMHAEDVPIGWNARILTAGARERLESALMRVGHSTYEDFPAVVEELFDVDQVLRYFAVIYAVVGHDAVVDNYYVYWNPGTERFEFIPWDMDATLGLNWDGEYDPRNATYTLWKFFHSVLLQRMLEYPEWQAAFARHVEAVADDGFSFLHDVLPEEAARIRADVHADSSTGRTPDAFELAILQIDTFLVKRNETLATHQPFERRPMNEIRVSNPLPDPDEYVVTFELFSPVPQEMTLWLSYDLQREDWSATRRERRFRLYDDGSNGDREAGDGWYSAQVDLTPFLGHVILVAADAGYAFMPAAAVFSVHFRPSATYALNLTGASSEAYEALTVESVVKSGGETYVAIRNESDETLDLTGFYLQSGPYYQRVPIPWDTRVPAGELLVVGSNAAGAAARFPEAAVVPSLTFSISEGDTVRFLTPMQTVLSEHVADVEAPEQPLVVINEINYRSHRDLDTGDWLELYNPGVEPIELAGWQIRDGDDDHIFVLPENAVLPPDGFVVIAQSRVQLETHVEPVGEVFDGMDFGFDGAGELVRVFDAHGEEVARVAYTDSDPWPTEPDGDGYTLELRDPTLPQDDPGSWAASLTRGGTPGSTNSVFLSPPPQRPPSFEISALYPNPVQDVLAIALNVERSGPYHFTIVDLLGREVQHKRLTLHAGISQTITIDVAPLASGTYLLSVESDGNRLDARHFVHIR